MQNNLDTAKGCRAERERIADEQKRLDLEHQQIIDESTAARLEKNRLARQQAINDLADLERAERRLVVATAESPQKAELQSEATRLLAEERAIRAEHPGVTRSYIRPDATKHYKNERDEAERRIEELERPFLGRTNATMGPRTSEEIRKLQAVVDEWPRDQKSCGAGERIAAIRERLRAISADQAELDNQRRQQALGV